MKQILWWICLLVAPVALISVELFHPAGFTAHRGMYQFLSHAEHHEPQFRALAYFGPHWWLVLHMIQTPMVGLVAVGLWLMVDGIGRDDGSAAMGCAWLARSAIFVFLIYFTVLDAIGGIGLGRTILTVQSLVADGKLSPQQFDGIVLLLNTIWTDPLDRRCRIVRQRDGILGGVCRRGLHRCGCSAVGSGWLGKHGAAGRLRLGTADQPRQPAWPDRFRPAHRRVGLDVVDPTATRSPRQNHLRL
jgi:hypothetical protein